MGKTFVVTSALLLLMSGHFFTVEAQQPNAVSPSGELTKTVKPRIHLQESQLQGLLDLGQELSLRRDWLQGAALEALRTKGMTLPQLFDEAPAALRIGGQWYWLRLELMGSPEPSVRHKGEQLDGKERDEVIVYLSHEIYDAPGKGAALGFSDGELVTVLEKDLEGRYAVALTLEKADIPIKSASKAPDTRWSQLTLGAVREQQLSEAAAVRKTRLDFEKSRPKACTQAPRCGGVTVLSCDSAGFEPYFTINRIRINQDHEPWTQGQPEIDLFPLVFDPGTGAGGDSDIRSQFVFKGHNVTDAAGQGRYLPDVNSANRWYSFSDTAIFPMGDLFTFAAALTEDDSGEGRLRMANFRDVHVDFFDSNGNLSSEDNKSLDRFQALSPSGALQDTIAVSTPHADDLFSDAIGIDEFMGCFAGDTQLTLDTDDWSVRGRFLCIDNSCSPPVPACTQTGTLCGFNSECCSRTCASLGFAGLKICA